MRASNPEQAPGIAPQKTACLFLFPLPEIHEKEISGFFLNIFSINSLSDLNLFVFRQIVPLRRYLSMLGVCIGS